MKKEDKTAKLSLVIHNQKRAIVQYEGGDSMCIWSTRYLLIISKNQMNIYEIGGFSGNYAPVEPVFL